MLSFDDFKDLAKDDRLKSYEKVGFLDCHRKDSEENIFNDIFNKLELSFEGGGKSIMDIGCGCSKPALMLIDFAKTYDYNLFLVDSKEMLNNLSNEKFITKLPFEFPKCDNLEELKNSMDYIIIYSVIHHVIWHSNYIKFLDAAVALLKEGGRLLLADIPNMAKKKRFLSSSNGIKFHQEWSRANDVPEVKWNELDNGTIDDSLIFSILMRYRNMGCETYLLEQKDGLPMNNTREDILIKRN